MNFEILVTCHGLHGYYIHILENLGFVVLKCGTILHDIKNHILQCFSAISIGVGIVAITTPIHMQCNMLMQVHHS
jgi:hypothetical protein